MGLVQDPGLNNETTRLCTLKVHAWFLAGELTMSLGSGRPSAEQLGQRSTEDMLGQSFPPRGYSKTKSGYGRFAKTSDDAKPDRSMIASASLGKPMQSLNDLAEALPQQVFQYEASEDDEVFYNELLLWRLAYRRHRIGEAQGAKGEITALADKLDTKKFNLKLLPVSEYVSMRMEESTRNLAVERPDVSKSLHVHFGAGRLALGLVIPALEASGRPFAIIQRPSGEFKAMVEKGGGRDVTLNVNADSSVTLTLITCEEDLQHITATSKLFVCSDDPLITRVLLRHSPTMSTGLGPALGAVLLPLLEDVFELDTFPRDQGSEAGEYVSRVYPEMEEDSRPAMYCCENDHKAVEKLEDQMVGAMDVVACMVDRICTARTVTEDGVITTAEPYKGSIVVLSPPPCAPLPAFAGPTVAIPRTSAAANYLCRRKLLTVNGMHTTLAFLTLRKHESGPGVAGDYPLVTTKTANEQECDVIRCWAVARCCLLIFEHDIDVMKSAHGVETNAELFSSLLAISNEVLKRFETTDDTTKRVLAGGIKNRWETRLQNVEAFLKAGKLDGACNHMLQKAGITLEQMQKAVIDLVKDSKPFTYDAKSDAAPPGRSIQTRCLSRKALKIVFQAKAGVLFDFDGTLGDTETPAMEVAYWELAPYLPNVAPDRLEQEKTPFIQMNAGRAFEHMIESVNEQRAGLGLVGVEEAHQAGNIHAAALDVIDVARARFGLPEFNAAKKSYPTLLIQQKEETVVALGKVAQANPGVTAMLEELTSLGVPFNIATTSGKPRVPVCVDTCGLRKFFPTDDKIHSGESDFTPSRFKPDPDVYLKVGVPTWPTLLRKGMDGRREGGFVFLFSCSTGLSEGGQVITELKLRSN